MSTVKFKLETCHWNQSCCRLNYTDALWSIFLLQNTCSQVEALQED